MKKFLSKKEYAFETGRSLSTINRDLAAGRVPYVRINKRVLIPSSYLANLEADALAKIKGGE